MSGVYVQLPLWIVCGKIDVYSLHAWWLSLVLHLCSGRNEKLLTVLGSTNCQRWLSGQYLLAVSL